jgi:hypothetical protein
VQDSVVVSLSGLSLRTPAGALDDVTFQAPAGSVVVVFEIEPGAARPLCAALAGRARPLAGRGTVLGLRLDSWFSRRRLRRIVPAALPAPGRPASPLLVLRDISAAQAPTIRELAAGGSTVVAATADPAAAEAVADRLAVAGGGRFRDGGPTGEVQARFRRITYRNEVTPTRVDFGDELDEFTAVRVRVRGWGIEAVVSNYRPEAFEKLRRRDGVAEARCHDLTIAGICEALRSQRGGRGAGSFLE